MLTEEATDDLLLRLGEDEASGVKKRGELRGLRIESAGGLAVDSSSLGYDCKYDGLSTTTARPVDAPVGVLGTVRTESLHSTAGL